MIEREMTRGNKSITGKEDTVKKKICSLLLALLMVVTMLPVTAMGATAQLGDKVITGGKRDFKWPVKGWYGISSCFFDGRSHYAIDIPATEGTAVFAAYDGTVAEVTYNNGSDGGYGNGVLLKHTYKKMSGETITLYSRYAHMSSINVSSGQTVYAGQTVVGKVGGTGNGSVIYANHLDFQILTSSNWRNRRTCSIDPFSNELLELPSGVYTASTSDCCGVGPTGCCCNAYVQAIKKIYATPLTHTCDRGSFQWTWTAHPHYKCYKCSICGEIWADKTQPTKRDSCEQCYPRTATVTYYNADGAVWKTASGTADTSYTLNASYPTKSGSYFVGWSYTAGASGFDLRPNDTVTLKGSIDLYPVYVTHEQAVSGEGVYIYNISDFDSDGYNISSEDHTVQTRVDNSGWTSWSNYSLTEASASSTQQVRTTTMYLYYYFLCPSCGRHEPFWGKSDCGATITTGAWHEGWFDTPYSACNPQSFSYTTSKYYTTSLGDGQVWIFSAGNLNDTSVGTTDAAGSSVVIRTGYSTRQWVTKFNTVDRTATAYRITKVVETSGVCGENLTWKVENGVLTISGTGLMADYDEDNAPWKGFQSEITSVVITSGATSIGNLAFKDCENLTSVVIPDGITKIGKKAFINCGSLAAVTLPKSVTDIEPYSFFNCTSLESMVIPEGVTVINAFMFANCGKLKTVKILGTISSVGPWAFVDCDALTDVYYGGTEAQWNTVEIGSSGNDPLRNATIHFTEPDPQPPVETSGTIAVSSVRARAGQTITVKVNLSANKGISNMRLQMTYPEGFTLENVQKGDALSSLTFTPPGKLSANPVNFVWDGTEADTSEGCILELTFRVADTVAVGDYSISLSYQRDDVLDGDLESIDLTLQDGTVSVVEFTRGDIDGDGVIGMKDLGTLRKYFAGGYDAGNFVMEAADLDGDGGVTMKDLGVLRRYLAGGYDINLGE